MWQIEWLMTNCHVVARNGGLFVPCGQCLDMRISARRNICLLTQAILSLKALKFFACLRNHRADTKKDVREAHLFLGGGLVDPFYVVDPEGIAGRTVEGRVAASCYHEYHVGWLFAGLCPAHLVDGLHLAF